MRSVLKKRFDYFKDAVPGSGLKKSIFFTYFESIIYWEYTVKILD